MNNQDDSIIKDLTRVVDEVKSGKMTRVIITTFSEGRGEPRLRARDRLASELERSLLKKHMLYKVFSSLTVRRGLSKLTATGGFAPFLGKRES